MIRLSLFAGIGFLTFACCAVSYAQTTPPPTTSPPMPATSAIPEPVFDRLSDNVGIAQQTAREKGLQARIMWMDAGANVGNLNSQEKIADIIDKVKATGLNMIVLDVKPIVGDVVYPSKYASRLTEWRGQKVDPSFDLLQHVLDTAHAAGLPVYANMSTFGEGHKFVGRGLAYTHPSWQTILYEVDRSVRYEQAVASIAVSDDLPANQDTLAALTSAGLLRKDRPGYTVAVINFDARVIEVYDGGSLSKTKPVIPPRGSALIGNGRSGAWIKSNLLPGRIVTFKNIPKYVPVVDAPDQKFTIFCDPNNPDVRQHELDIVREVAANYLVDGIIFDDRLRYADVTADFSQNTRTQFEQYIGKKINWPDDVLTISPYPGQDPIHGPEYQQWLNWRAGIITSWLSDAARLIRSTRPKAQVAVYAGSWYGDYEKVGSNWAADDFVAPYHWLTPEYRATGYAGMLDWITTGCYYPTATIAEAMASGSGLGTTVEAAGQLSNRVVNDATWTYAGLYALTYQGHPEAFARAIKAAGASTQGVMVFDLSQIVQYNWWPILNDAFSASPAQAPNTVPGLLDDVRSRHARDKAAGVPQPPLPPYLGASDTGF